MEPCLPRGTGLTEEPCLPRGTGLTEEPWLPRRAGLTEESRTDSDTSSLIRHFYQIFIFFTKLHVSILQFMASWDNLFVILGYQPIRALRAYLLFQLFIVA